MKKLFALLLAALLIVGMLPMTAMAEAPESVKVTIRPGTKNFSKTLADGEVAYVTCDDAMVAANWTDTATAPEDKYAKFEYDVESATMKITMKNFKADMTPAGGYTAHGFEFPAGAYTVAIELIGENLLQHGKSAAIKTLNDGGITVTGTEGSSLTLNMGKPEELGSATGVFWITKGDVIIKNTTLKANVYTDASPMHHVITACGGNVVMENLTIECKTNNGGHLVFMSDPTATTKNARSTMDKNPDRKVTFKDCKITSDTKSALVRSMSPVTLINTELKALSNSIIFMGDGKVANPPVIEGEFSAIAGLRKNAEKLDKLKEYNPKKLNSYTYLYIVPGKVDLLPTEATEAPTEAPTTEATEAPTTEATEAPTTEATKPVDATQPTTADKNEATQPADKDDNKTDDKGEEKSGSPMKIILIILIALVVLGGGAVAVILILRNKNAEEEDDEEEEEEEEEESEEETEE